MDVGPHFLQVPANQPGQEYAVGTLVIDPGTYTWQAHSPGQIKSLALLIVGLAGVYILIINPFSLLFFIPLLFWLFIGGRRGPTRVLDILLFALGGLVVYALFYYFGFFILRNNCAVLWYLMMMFSIGMIGFPTAVAIAAILAAGLAMLVSPPQQT